MHSFVLRIAKYSAGPELRKILEHCSRRFTPTNADPERANLNQTLGSADPYRFRTTRKNGVAAIEIVISASREWPGFGDGAQEWRRFYGHAYAFFLRRFGGHATLVTEHRDESVPHAHFLFSPSELGATARQLVGGTKYALTRLQADFQMEVASQFRLFRIPDSRVTHIQLRDFYARINNDMAGTAWRLILKNELDQLKAAAARGYMLEQAVRRQLRMSDDRVLKMLRAEMAWRDAHQEDQQGPDSDEPEEPEPF